MTNTNTNASSRQLAELLRDAKQGTFTGLITRKKGVVRGGKTYGDALVHAVIFTGFKYDGLVQRSLDLLDTVTDQEVVDASNGKVALADVAAARTELRASFERTLEGTNESTTDHVYETLTVSGETVRGGRVYKCVAGTDRKCHCRACSLDKRAPKDGVIYIQGLKIAQTELEAPANGYWKTNSSAKTIAKDILRRRLPVGRYVSYALEPGTDFILAAGGVAKAAATRNGITLDPAIQAALDSKAA